MSLRVASENHKSYGSIAAPLLDNTTVSNWRVGEYTREGDAAEDDLSTGSEGKMPARRQIGVFSALFIIFNRIIGIGVFATPSTILAHSGSVGMSLVMWLVGALVTAAGMQVYIARGTAFPQKGGEMNYLEYLFRKTKYLITSMYTAKGVLLAWTTGSSLIFGEYILKAVDLEPSQWGLRFVAFGCIMFAMLIHGTALKWGLRLQNFLGTLKLLVLLLIVGTGFLALTGHTSVETPRVRNLEHIFEGTSTDASSFCLCLYNVLWSYIGFSNVNYAFSQVENPRQTLRIAGPLAIGVVTVLYLLANIAYFAGASKEEITGSGRLVAALLFRNVYGVQAERMLDAFVALCALGNVMSVVCILVVRAALGNTRAAGRDFFWVARACTTQDQQPSAS